MLITVDPMNLIARRHFIDIMCTFWRTYICRPEKKKKIEEFGVDVCMSSAHPLTCRVADQMYVHGSSSGQVGKSMNCYLRTNIST